MSNMYHEGGQSSPKFFVYTHCKKRPRAIFGANKKRVSEGQGLQVVTARLMYAVKIWWKIYTSVNRLRQVVHILNSEDFVGKYLLKLVVKFTELEN